MANTDVDLAFRARCISLTVVSTGESILSATATGYARTSGSFVTDGFEVGMEVVPAGFPETASGTILRVEPLRLTIYQGRQVAASAAARSLTVGLPVLRIWDNKAGSPDPMVPYVEGEFMTQPGELLSASAQGGYREDRGLFVLRWYGIADFGALGLRRCVDALMELFTPHTTFTAGTDVVRIRGDSTPDASRVTQRASGHALVTLTFPWRVYRRNVITV